MYDYETEKQELFTESGQVTFLKIRDKVHALLESAGAFNMSHAIANCGGGSSWTMIACIDRLVELGEIVEVTDDSWMTQFKVYARPTRSCR